MDYATCCAQAIFFEQFGQCRIQNWRNMQLYHTQSDVPKDDVGPTVEVIGMRKLVGSVAFTGARAAESGELLEKNQGKFEKLGKR